MPKRVDENQVRIVTDLRNAGFSVVHLSTIGHGCPDILVGYKGVNYLFEIKNPAMPPSKRKLTMEEKAWHYSWLGQVGTIYYAEDAVRIIANGRRSSTG